jgi:hypothetical protein
MVLERVDGRMSRVLSVFKGQTVVCMASGPSLTVEQVEAVRIARLPTFVCNDSYRIAPFAEVCYFADGKWFLWNVEKPEWKAFAGQKCTIEPSAPQVKDAAVHVLKNLGHEGLSNDPAGIMTGSHSGYQLINLATLTQPARILLLGYDCGRVNGRKHWFGEHPDGTEPPYDGIKKHYNRMEQDAKRFGIEILNATPGSAIDAFRKVELAGILNSEAAAVVS